MAIELSTAGILVKYAVETTSGTRPTTGYTVIPGIKSIPEFNPEPSNLEVTDLSDPIWRRYIPGLKDPGGAMGLTVNNTTAFQEAWNAMLTASETARENKMKTWFEYYVPNFGSFYYAGVPSELGFGGAEVDSVLENTAYIVPNEIFGWGESSTTA